MPPPGAKSKHLDVRQLDLRVGRIQSVEELPVTKGSYTMSLDVAMSEYKTALTELPKFYEIDDLLDRRVVTVLNLPICHTDGIATNARILCAIDGDKVEILNLPYAMEAGTKVYVPGFEQHTYWQVKLKNYEKMMEDIVVNKDKEVYYSRMVPMRVTGVDGTITSDTLTNCRVNYF